MGLDWFKKQPNTVKKVKDSIDNVEEEKKQPVSLSDIEELIRIITICNDIDTKFSLTLELEIGEFTVTSDNFKGIKMMKANKNQPNRLVISHSNALLMVDTMIEATHIVSIAFALNFCRTGEPKSDEDV